MLILAVQIGEAIIKQYQKSPTIDKVLPQLNKFLWSDVVHTPSLLLMSESYG